MAQIIANRYQIDELIGRGGMGDVYSGIDLQTGQPVAIKCLHSDIVERSPDSVERFRREGEALRQLNHPNIVQVLATAQEGDKHYIVMEKVSGGTLADLLRTQTHLPLSRVLSIALELGDALARAHHLRIIHRDIKPSNVLLAEDGTPRLSDFGVAQTGDSNLTEVGAAIGTFAYLSPEACRGEKIDVRTDIWSFGVLLYELLAGRRPFEVAQPVAIITEILTKPIPDIEQYRQDLPVALVDLIYRMLEKNRDARIPRMRMVGAELEAIIDGLDTHIRPPIAIDEETTPLSRFATETTSPPTFTPSRGSTANNLPAYTTPFVGREQELKELDRLFSDSNNRLLTLTGPGGIGKTRVAVAAAERQLERFFHGVFYIPLAPISAPDLIVTAIAEHISFTFGGTSDPTTELLNFLREKSMLLLMDNFEHLIDSAEIVTDILQAAPEVRILVISRERLRVRGEYLLEMHGMIMPAVDETPELIASYPAVKLFQQVTSRITPEFTIDDETAPLVARIIQLVAGMPLGIELAAAWLEVLPIEEVVAEIEASLDFLETDLRDVPERHRSLRAVFDSSWNLMTENERDVFMQLSVFRGGFTREAAQKVTGASLRHLTTLVNQSLLKRAADGRYTPHILLRQYAEEIFASFADKLYATRKAHAACYAEFMQQQAQDFNSKYEKKAAEAIEVEIENVRAAWHWSVENGEWEPLETLLHPLYLFYTVRSLQIEGLTNFRLLADKLQTQPDHPLYWRARVRQSQLSSRLGDHSITEQYVPQALTFFRRTENHVEICMALNVLCYLDMMQGRYEDAYQHGCEALETARTINHKEQLLLSMGNLGYVEYLLGRFADATKTYEEFNHISEERGSPISLAYGTNNLGEILHASGDTEGAKQLYERAYEIFRSFKHRRGMAFTLNNLGGIYFVTGETAEAKRRYEESYELNKKIGDRSGTAHSLSALGNIAMWSKNPTEAQNYYQQSLDIRREIGDKRGIADSLSDLAGAAVANGDMALAERYHEESLQIRQQIGDRYGAARSIIGAGMAMIAMGEYQTANTHLQKALNIADEIDNDFVRSWALGALGEVAFQTGDHKLAEQRFRQSLQIARDRKLTTIALFDTVGMASLLSVQGEQVRALELATYVYENSDELNRLIVDRTVGLINDLKTQLPAAISDAAQDAGRTLVLESIMDSLLR